MSTRSGGLSREDHSGSTEATLLTCRVDALRVAFKVDLLAQVSDELIERQAIADEAGAAELRLGGISFALRKHRGEDLWFENADLGGTVYADASGGWNLELVFRAMFLATHALPMVVQHAFDVARIFGAPREHRLRRIDLAADYVRFPLADDDVRRVITRARRRTTFLTDQKDSDEDAHDTRPSAIREHRSALGVTGVTVGAGPELMARIYDKTSELKLPGREQKRAVEFDLWKAAGWNGAEPVTRVEFQCRGAFLDEARLRTDLGRLGGRLDKTWQYCCRNWLRLIVSGSATRQKRCRIDPRWTAVQLTVFDHPSAPLKRARIARGTVKGTHVLGAALSFSAARGDLEAVDLGVDEVGQVLTEREFSERMTDEQAAQWVADALDRSLLDASTGMTADLIKHHGPHKAAMIVAARINAKAARFSSIDDEARR